MIYCRGEKVWRRDEEGNEGKDVKGDDEKKKKKKKRRLRWKEKGGKIRRKEETNKLLE